MIKFWAIKTSILKPPKDDLLAVLDEYLCELQNEDILLISSKVLAIHQGRCIKKTEVNKLQLIYQEADYVYGEITDPCITIKDHTFIPNSGIDESNGDEYYILWPQEVGKLLKEIHAFLSDKFQLTKLGIISVDSHILPMRTGTVGLSQASFGFIPICPRVGDSDLFGRKLRISHINLADCLSGIAPVIMGEGNECCPVAIIRGVSGIKFCEQIGDLSISNEQDIFRPFFKY